MTTVLDGPLRAVTLSLVTKFGATITVRYVTLGTYQTATGDAVDTTTDVPTKGIWQDYKAKEVRGLIQEGDRRLLLAASGLAVPTPQDRIVDGGVELEIVTVEQVRSGELAALYIVQTRGAP